MNLFDMLYYGGALGVICYLLLWLLDKTLDAFREEIAEERKRSDTFLLAERSERADGHKLVVAKLHEIAQDLAVCRALLERDDEEGVG